MESLTIKVTVDNAATELSERMIEYGMKPKTVIETMRRILARIDDGDTRMYNSDLGAWIEVI